MILTIKSDTNGLEQQVTQDVFDALKKNGYKGRIIATHEKPKTAKEPAEVTAKK